MTHQYAKVKYAVYNSRSIQAESDDGHGSDKSYKANVRHRNPRGIYDTKVIFKSPSMRKSHSTESYSEPPVTLHQVSGLT